jgi:hypothetical protein
MAESEVSVSVTAVPIAGTFPPAWAPGLLAAALPIAVVLSVTALVVASLVFPLFDVTPAFVLAVALIARRWQGALAKRFTAPMILAAVVLAEWIAWDLWYYFVAYQGDLSTYGFDQIVRQFGNPVVVLLLVQMIALLVLFGRATLPSLKGVRKVRGRV